MLVFRYLISDSVSKVCVQAREGLGSSLLLCAPLPSCLVHLQRVTEAHGRRGAER